MAGTIIITAYVIQNGIPVITPGEVRLPPFGDFINCMAKPKPGSKPKKGVPPGTIPINQSGLPHETIERIKKQIGAAPTDWVGISPEGDVISGDAEGNAVNQGPKESY